VLSTFSQDVSETEMKCVNKTRELNSLCLEILQQLSKDGKQDARDRGGLLKKVESLLKDKQLLGVEVAHLKNRDLDEK